MIFGVCNVLHRIIIMSPFNLEPPHSPRDPDLILNSSEAGLNMKVKADEVVWGRPSLSTVPDTDYT